MDYSRLISAIFRDKPGVMYENPPPPSDYSEEDFEPVFFTYPRPQSVKFHPEMRFLTIDRSLIHKSLLGYEEQEEEQITTKCTKRNENETGNENIMGIKAIKIEESSIKIPMNKNILEKEFDKKKKKEDKHKDRPKGEKKNDYDSDDSKSNKKKKGLVTESSTLQSLSESDSDHSEKHRSKSSSHHVKSRSKKLSQHRKKHKHSKLDSSYSDAISHDKVDRRSAEFSIKGEIDSCDEEASSLSFSKKVEITLKEEELSDKDNNRKDKIKSSESSKKKYDDSGSLDDFRNSNNSRIHDDLYSSDGSRDNNSWSRKVYRKDRLKSSKNSEKKYDSISQNDLRNSDNSRNHIDSNGSDDSRDRNDLWSRNDSKHRFIDSWSHDDIKNRFDDSETFVNDYENYGDSNSSSRCFNSCMQRDVKKEIKQEPGSASYYRTNDYYCGVCKLSLNSESTFNSHMAGKRHKKALRQLSENEVAKSSVLEITESQNISKTPDLECIQLYEEQSKIQETCEDADLLIVGLDYVREIRGLSDTKFFCDLCNAQCDANSVIKHLIGFKHQMNCLKTYCYRSYCWLKNVDKRDRKAERELKFRLKEILKEHGPGKIKVFTDVIRNQRSPDPFNPHQPSTSRQAILPKDLQGKKADEPKVTDEECLSRDYSDFYCKVCDSHMNNLSMWESHARGRKHAKNKKKAEEGGGMNNNFIEAPQGTISHLEEMIEQQCDPNDIIVGLNFIRENQGDNGDLYNCFLCGSVCPTIDIIDHLYLKKHKTKYLEKMHSDGYHNAINEINSLPIGVSAREALVDDECEKLMHELGRGKVVIAITKKTF